MRAGVAVVVLLAFLVLAGVSYFDIFAIFGGTVYPSWDCLRRAKQARSPRPRPRAPVPARPVSDRSREGVVLSRPASRVLSERETEARELEVGSYARRAPMKVSLPRVRYGHGDDIDITVLQHKLGLSLSASRVARPIGRLESVSYQFVEAVLVFAHALAKR